MLHLMKGFGLASVLFFLAFSSQIANDWKLNYNHEGLWIYTRSRTNGLTEFKGVTTIKAPLKQVAALLDDAKQQQQFVYKVKHSSTIEELNTNEKIVYSIIGMPWPLEDRDIVSKSYSSYNSVRKTAIIKLISAPDYIPHKKNLKRMEIAEGFWQLKSIDELNTEVTYQFVFDPGGVPNWVLSMFILDAPKETLQKLKTFEAVLQRSNNDLPWID